MKSGWLNFLFSSLPLWRISLFPPTNLSQNLQLLYITLCRQLLRKPIHLTFVGYQRVPAFFLIIVVYIYCKVSLRTLIQFPWFVAQCKGYTRDGKQWTEHKWEPIFYNVRKATPSQWALHGFWKSDPWV